MKRLIKLFALLSVMTTASASYGADLVYGNSEFGVSDYIVGAIMSPVATVSAPFAAVTLSTSGLPYPLQLKLEAVQDDARSYLAGNEMSENLEDAISSVDEIALENGLDQLAGNPERIALEIIKL